MSGSIGEWENRYSLSPDVIDRDGLQQWAGDRERYLTFSVDITHRAVHDALEQVRSVLATHDCVTVAPPEYYHITAKQIGCIRDPPKRESDITSSTANRLQRRARETLAEVEPFEVSFPQLDLFDRVIFCEVQAGDPMLDVHRRLCDLPAVPQWQHEREDYVPHMTISHFQSRDGFEELITDLEPLRDLDIPPVTIDSISLQEMHPAELYPSRETIVEFKL